MNFKINKQFADKVIVTALKSRPKLDNIQTTIFNAWSKEESKHNVFINLGIGEYEYMRNAILERLS